MESRSPRRDLSVQGFNMKKITMALCVTILLLLPSAASAGGFELTPFMGYQFGGDITTFYEGAYHDVGINSSENFGLMVNIDLGDMAQLEFLYNTQDTRAKAKRFDDKLDLTTIRRQARPDDRLLAGQYALEFQPS